MTRLALLAVLLLGGSTVAQAQTTYMDLSNQYATAARNTWEQVIRPKFIAAMSPDDQATLLAIDFRFPAGGGSFDAFATRERGQMVVVISSAFVAYQDAAIEAMITARQFGMMDRLIPYLEFADQRGIANAARIRNGLLPELVPTFGTFAQLDPAAYAAFAQTPEYGSLKYQYRLNSLAYVLGHEIGHHVRRHYGRTTDAEQTRREFQADLYSTELLLKSGLSPLGAGPLMIFFQEGGSDSRHPPGICRLITFTFLALPTIKRDAVFQKYLQEHPAEKQAFDQGFAFIAANKPTIQAACGDNVIFE